MKKIAIFLPDLRGGGAERVNLDLAHGLTQQGYQVEFVLMRAEGVFLEEAADAFSVVDLNILRSRQVPLALARYLRDRRPDALVASIWPLTTCAAIARVLARQPTRVLLVEHNTLSRQYSAWGWLHKLLLRSSLALGCRLADAVAAVSRGAADDLAKLALCAPEQVSVLYNPIPSRPLLGPVDRAEALALWPDSSGPKIICVGSLTSQKNHALLLRAFALLPKELDASLMILGEGALRSELEALASTLGIDRQLALPGFFSNPTGCYASANLFVLSSDYEGFGNVLVEAMACGVPVVSTDCPFGPAEILAYGKYGLLVPIDNVHALASAMADAIQATHDHEALKARAQEFHLEAAITSYLKLLLPTRD